MDVAPDAEVELASPPSGRKAVRAWIAACGSDRESLHVMHPSALVDDLILGRQSPVGQADERAVTIRRWLDPDGRRAYRLPGALMRPMVRRSVDGDLRRLKNLVEADRT